MLKCTFSLFAHRLEIRIMLWSSFLLGRFRTVHYFLVALPVAALLSEKGCVNTELFRNWLELEQHNGTHRNETPVTSSDWQRRNTYGTNTHF